MPPRAILKVRDGVHAIIKPMTASNALEAFLDGLSGLQWEWDTVRWADSKLTLMRIRVNDIDFAYEISNHSVEPPVYLFDIEKNCIVWHDPELAALFNTSPPDAVISVEEAIVTAAAVMPAWLVEAHRIDRLNQTMARQLRCSVADIPDAVAKLLKEIENARAKMLELQQAITEQETHGSR